MAAEAKRATRSRGQSRIACADPAIAISEMLARLHTADLRIVAAAAIDLLDVRAGDCDFEDDDPSGDALDEQGEHQSDDGSTILPTKPAYAADQSEGPINGHAAYIDYHAAQIGAVRTARGGWAIAA